MLIAYLNSVRACNSRYRCVGGRAQAEMCCRKYRSRHSWIDTDVSQVAKDIMDAHQARIPPSRRTEGYRTLPDSPNDDGHQDPSLSLENDTGKRYAKTTKTTHKQDLDKQYGKRKARKILAGQLAVEGGQVFDMSLWRACYLVNMKHIWWSSILSLVGSEYQLLLASGSSNSCS